MGDAFFLGRDLHVIAINAGEISVRVSRSKEGLSLEHDILEWEDHFFGIGVAVRTEMFLIPELVFGE